MMIEVTQTTKPKPVLPPNSKYEDFVPYRIVQECGSGRGALDKDDIVFFATSPCGNALVINATKKRAFAVGRFTGDDADIYVEQAVATVVIQ